MLLENCEDRFFVLLYLEIGKKDKYERSWMFINLFMNFLGFGVQKIEEAERVFGLNTGLLEEVVKRAKEFWKRKRTLYTPLFPVFIPSFMYCESDERIKKINSLYYSGMYYKKNEGDLEKAYEEYKNLLENEKDKTKRAVILNNLGCLSLILKTKKEKVEKEDITKFFEFFNKGIGEAPLPEIAYNTAVISFMLKGYEQAVSAAEATIKLAPEWAEAHYLKAEALKNLGRNQEAVEEYKKAIELGMVNQLEMVAKKELEKLEMQTTRLTPIEKIMYDEYGKIGVEVYRRLDGASSAEDIIKELGINKEKLIEILKFIDKMGIAKIEGLDEIASVKKKRFASQCEDIIREVKKEEGKSRKAKKYFQIGNAHYEKEEYEKAIENYNMAILSNPLFCEAYFNRAMCYYKLEKYDKSLADYTKAAELDQNNPMIYNNKGNAYYRKQQFHEAIKDYNKAIELHPSYIKAFYNRGLSYASLENYEKVIEDFSEVIELKPDFAEAWHLRGLAYEYAGRLYEAIRDYEKALELNPELVEAKAHLEAAKVKRGQAIGGEKLKKYRDKDGFIEVDFETPKVNFQNIAGMDRWKKGMELEVIHPLKNRKLAEKYGVKGGNILLYGPPGCGKSLIAEAIAGELGTKVIKVDIAEILSMYVGNAEKNMKAIFEKAEENQPCILIFDELEGLGGVRESRICNVGLVDQFVKCLDEIKKKKLDVLVIGTTNMPWMVDSAIVRRFNSIVYIPEPDEETRKELFKYYTRNLPIEEVDFEELARKTEGMASSNIENICKKAALFAYRDALEGKERKIRMEDFEEATKEERSAVQLWKEQGKNYNISPMFKEMGLEEKKEEKKQTGMYG